MNIFKKYVQRNIKVYTQMPRIIAYLSWIIDLVCLFAITRCNIDSFRFNTTLKALDIFSNIVIMFIALGDGMALYHVLKNDQ